MTESLVQNKPGMASIKEMPVVQDGPPPGGFAPVRFAHRIPTSARGTRGTRSLSLMWLIFSYKAWGALLGRRNFPQGTISDMVSDASEAISFICNNVVSFGGDPNKTYLMGQSAGAHIVACTLLEQAIKESKGENTYWNVAQIKAYFGLSGGYNIQNLVDHFHERGVFIVQYFSADKLPSVALFSEHIIDCICLSVSRSLMLCSTFAKLIKEDMNKQPKMESSLT
ncbi:putative isoprenylcysteine alpha-carbonyl methylesterase ICMEL2 [Zea mays]|uniref:Putative isoprenylcysteine alpha-carbonyl methylesterase ICMEL2 n=1 Tax=Zea mays TaxID=4577 RepID=A0A1D6EGD4_MAIZE|nr:putative isoprenylcysteine alpha-carbonyl methylesterase ICMEL2 [Zea mays]